MHSLSSLLHFVLILVNLGADVTAFSTTSNKGTISMSTSASPITSASTRRQWIASSIATMATFGIQNNIAKADEGGEQPQEAYDNPSMPDAPEERSGLTVLRVAEVCDFQEKILRAVVNDDIETVISPQQIVFGTQVLLRNSNIAGNMKLMIETEIPNDRRDKAVRDVVVTMNTLQAISSYAARILRPFKDEEMLQIADLYRDVKLSLNNLYEYLPPKEKEKYYGYFMAVTEYEKKIAEGVYNPETDGVLKLDY